MSRRAFRVVVTREDGQWLADVPELYGAHTYARSLPSLDQAVREVVVLAADLPDEAMPELVLDYDYHTGDPELDATALEVRRLRRQADDLPPPRPPAPAGRPPSLSRADCPCVMWLRCWASARSGSPSSPPKSASARGAIAQRCLRVGERPGACATYSAGQDGLGAPGVAGSGRRDGKPRAAVRSRRMSPD